MTIPIPTTPPPAFVIESQARRIRELEELLRRYMGTPDKTELHALDILTRAILKRGVQ